MTLTGTHAGKGGAKPPYCSGEERKFRGVKTLIEVGPLIDATRPRARGLPGGTYPSPRLAPFGEYPFWVWRAVTTLLMLPRALKSPTTPLKRGSSKVTRASRIRFTAAPWKISRARNLFMESFSDFGST